jgi:TonB family protein
VKFRNHLILFIFLSVLSFPLKLHAQESVNAVSDSVYLMKDVDRAIIGGTMIGMSTITVFQTKYPDVKRKNRKKGSVIIKIILDQEGYVTNPTIVESLGKEYDDEAMRVTNILQSKKWQAGTKDGKAVKVSMLIPFTFDPDKK